MKANHGSWPVRWVKQEVPDCWKLLQAPGREWGVTGDSKLRGVKRAAGDAAAKKANNVD